MYFADIYILCLISATIIGGIVNLFQLINFIKQTKSRFLKSRNPPIIIMYCIISLATTFTTTPLNLYYHRLTVKGDAPFFAEFATEFFHEFFTVMLLVLIICRSWLLFYDYKFSESSSDEIWRHIVNETETNFWLAHRKTFGNQQFIICIALIIDSISLVCFSFVGSLVLKAQDSAMFHYFSLLGLGIPIYAFILYLIMYKIKLFNDVYLIHKEIKYLSVCILARIVSFCIDLFLHKYDQWLFFMTIEVLTTFLSVWIQCWWVLNQVKLQQNQDRHLEYHNSNSVPNNKQKRKMSTLHMGDVFEEKHAFETFIRHCTHELSVESILFLIEVAQFKATLTKHNAHGINALHTRFIDVDKVNIIKYIQQNRDANPDKERLVTPNPAPLVHNDSNNNLLVPSPSLALHADSNTISTAPERTPPPPQMSPPPPSDIELPNVATFMSVNSQSTAGDVTDIIAALQNETGNKIVSPKLSSQPSLADVISGMHNKKDAFVSSKRQEKEYTLFQRSVLHKKWLPIATPLLDVASDKKRKNSKRKSVKHGDGSEKSQTGTGTTAISALSDVSHKTKTKSKTIFSKSSRELRVKDKLRANAFITPITLAVIDDSVFFPSVNGKESEEKDRESQTVDINWIYEYARHLYLKYCDNSADWAINVSHITRKKLWSVYSKELNEEAFQKIQLIHHNSLSTISTLNIKEEQSFIQTYLYHSFDLAFGAVWTLLKTDTFYRFQKTKPYQMLCEELDIQKIQNAREKRERDYSESLQKSPLDI